MMFLVLFIFSLLLFMLLILAHEFGHSVKTKKFGVKATEFSIEIEPILFKKEKNKTFYCVRLIPIKEFYAFDENIKNTT